MAVRTSGAREQPTERMIDLRDLGARLPDSASQVRASIHGDVAMDARIILERTHVWEIDVALGTAEIEAVYDDALPVEKPQTVPDWLEGVLGVVGIDEVTL